MDVFEIVRKVLELGWPGIVLFQVAVVWNAYQARTEQLIDALKECASLTQKLLDK
jgi:hypothetical protein